MNVYDPWVTAAWGIVLTTEMARQIRAWRADGCSYRAIAELADESWGTTSEGNQLFATDLCLESAAMLNENPNLDPWQ